MDPNVKVPFMITNAQLRAARGLLGWSQARLAEASGLGIATIKRMEGERGPLRSSAENVLKVQQALEDAGVFFIDEDEELGQGVRLAKTRRSLVKQGLGEHPVARVEPNPRPQ